MRRKEIENKLNITISNSVPDVLENILTKCEKNKKFKEDFVKKEIKSENKKQIFTPKLVYVMAMVVICICGVFGLNQYNKVYKTDSVINFDVNPSVELKVNKNEEIIKVVPLNEDGEKILDDMDFEKVELDVAVNAIIGSMLKHGYITIDENSILVSVKNNDIEKANKLKEKISNDINEILNASSINGSILSQAYNDDTNINDIATKNQISEGKTRLINNILSSNIKDSKGNAYTFESLSKLSINELNLLLTSKNVELKDTSTTGTASEGSYIGKEKAKQIAFSNAGISSNNVRDLELELDADDGRLVYEIEFKSGNTEYEYDIDAKTGDIITKEVDKDDDNRNKTTTNSNSTTNTVPSTNTTTNNNRYDDYDNRYDDDDDDDRYDDDDDDDDD